MDWRQLTPSSRYKSFKCAVRGVGDVAFRQPNTWIIALASVVVVITGLYFQIGRLEWCAIFAAIFLIWMAEIFNTAVEYLTDLVSPEYHPLAGKAKDAAAGAVLVAVIFSLVIAGLIFLPRLLR